MTSLREKMKQKMGLEKLVLSQIAFNIHHRKEYIERNKECIFTIKVTAHPLRHPGI